MSEVSETLEDAADYLDSHDWVQGRLGDEAGVCAMGAICAVTNYDFKNGFWPSALDSNRHLFAGDALRDYLGEHLQYTGWVPSWNDEEGRTKEEVLDALRGAAKQERLKEEGLL